MHPEIRLKIIRLSTYAANAGGAEFCKTKCPHVVNPNPYEKDLKTRRCCVGCGYAHGYNNDPDEVREKLEKEYGFTEKNGYWTPKGCKLPREKRSNLCLDFLCMTYKKEGPNPGNIIEALSNARYTDVETR